MTFHRFRLLYAESFSKRTVMRKTEAHAGNGPENRRGAAGGDVVESGSPQQAAVPSHGAGRAGSWRMLDRFAPGRGEREGGPCET